MSKYLCLKCAYMFSGSSGPTTCPMCSYKYVEWLNYNDQRKQWFPDGKY